MRYVYPAIVHDADERGFHLVTFPDVPEAGTDARSQEEALNEAPDALAAALAGYVHARRAIPSPSPVGVGRVPVAVPPLVAAKLALYETMREQRVSNSELARRLGKTENAVRRLVDPDHSSRIEGIEAALTALGRRLIVEAA